MRVPWLVVGVVVGALLMRTWPGQDEFGVAIELLVWCGGGLLVGAYCDYLRTGPLTGVRISTALAMASAWLAVGFAWRSCWRW